MPETKQMPETCPFCSPDRQRIWFEGQTGVVLWDAFPISEGHASAIRQKSFTLLPRVLSLRRSWRYTFLTFPTVPISSAAASNRTRRVFNKIHHELISMGHRLLSASLLTLSRRCLAHLTNKADGWVSIGLEVLT